MAKKKIQLIISTNKKLFINFRAPKLTEKHTEILILDGVTAGASNNLSKKQTLKNIVNEQQMQKTQQVFKVDPAHTVFTGKSFYNQSLE